MADNIHATGVVLGDRGVLILGASGAGKSTLALALLTRFRQDGRYAALIGDDQLFLGVRGGRLVATAPATIEGLIEIRGAGPVRIAHRRQAVIDRIARLVPEDQVERLPEPGREMILGVTVPVVEVPQRNAGWALSLVLTSIYSPTI